MQGRTDSALPDRRPRVGFGRVAALGAIVALCAPAAIVTGVQPAAAMARDISTIAGTGTVGENGDGIAAVNATVDNPQGVAVDGHGNTLIADTGNNRVRVVAVSASNPGYPLAGCAGTCTWTVGDIYIIAGDGTGYNGDAIPATSAELNGPTDVTVDTVGNPLIADAGNQRVRVVAVSATNPGYPLPRWTVGDIYTMAGNGPGTSHYNGDGIYSTVAQLFNPERVTVDVDGNALIADSGNSRVRVVAVSTTNPGYPLAGCGGPCVWNLGDIYTIAGDGTGGYSGDDIPATGAELNAPAGVAVDSSGNVSIADTSNDRMRVVAVSASNPGYPLASWTVGDIYTVAGDGVPSYTTDGIPAVNVELNAPQDVTIDRHGNELITDSNNARVRVIAVSASNPGYPLGGCAGPCTWTVGNSYTVAGDGTASYNGDNILATNAQLNVPAGIAIDAAGNLYIADSFNSRIRAVEIGVAVTTPCAPTTVSALPRHEQAVLHWTAPSCNGGSPITGYRVTPYVKSSALPARSYTAHATTDIVAGLTVAKTYRFRVAARNAAGLGPSSPFSNAVTIGAPDPPTAVRALKVGAGSLKVTFATPANNGAPIKSYTAACTSSNRGVAKTKTGNASPLTVTALTANKSYTCSVTAANSRGKGPPSVPSATVKA
jgi:hypothetical protein